MGATNRRRGGDQRKRVVEATSNVRQNNIKNNDVVSIPQDEPWTPGSYAAFKILMSARLCAALWTGISDCDETYNYWEPTHYLLFNKGFQTWEYSPSYAIRSYAYLTLHAFPMKIYAFINVNKIFLFYFLRCILAIACSVTELYFYNGVCKLFGAKIGRLMLWFMLFSTGMFISCSSYLPSSFSMYLTMVAMGAWYQKSYHFAILSVAASAFIGWPFSAVLGIPIACDVLMKKKISYFIYWCFVALLLFLLPVVVIDSYYYDKLVIAPLNILLYNIFTEHGPDIYGTEPFTFYFLNGFLNFNIAFLLALICLPIAVVAKFICKQSKNSDIPLWLSMGPMFIWIIIFFTRPHKEERFLFPIYPFFALGAAISITYMEDIFCSLFSSKKFSSSDSYHFLSVICAAIFTVLSVSRTLQLYQGYHAPMDIYLELNQIASKPEIHTMSTDKQVNVCMGKEWYRFPSSFFLPHNNWHLRFIKSEFKGQLPKPYYQGPDSTSTIPSHMNNMNMEEPTRYINVSKCHYLIDLDVPTETKLEPRYSKKTQEWKILVSSKFLYPQQSHRIFRAFYIPFISSDYCTYHNYNLLKAIRPTRPSSNREHL
ncbi:alpha-1,2-mannosyltransferase ALG9-like [Octopus vulgaris]|uniref:Mannosyltransferase n=1 Tax=Octopus vulgaris TaxID=6645 RepID=A0AA36BP28_OCTVU|nr:alpha-1,2-mannosyltransferase ALG9-like [Octopus vulgaris]